MEYKDFLEKLKELRLNENNRSNILISPKEKARRAHELLGTYDYPIVEDIDLLYEELVDQSNQNKEDWNNNLPTWPLKSKFFEGVAYISSKASKMEISIHHEKLYALVYVSYFAEIFEKFIYGEEDDKMILLDVLCPNFDTEEIPKNYEENEEMEKKTEENDPHIEEEVEETGDDSYSDFDEKDSEDDEKLKEKVKKEKKDVTVKQMWGEIQKILNMFDAMIFLSSKQLPLIWKELNLTTHIEKILYIDERRVSEEVSLFLKEKDVLSEVKLSFLYLLRDILIQEDNTLSMLDNILPTLKTFTKEEPVLAISLINAFCHQKLAVGAHKKVLPPKFKFHAPILLWFHSLLPHFAKLLHTFSLNFSHHPKVLDVLPSLSYFVLSGHVGERAAGFLVEHFLPLLLPLFSQSGNLSLESKDNNDEIDPSNPNSKSLVNKFPLFNEPSLFDFLFLVSCKFVPVCEYVYKSETFQQGFFGNEKENFLQKTKNNENSRFFRVHHLLFRFCFSCHLKLEDFISSIQNDIKSILSDFSLPNLFSILRLLEGLEVLFDFSDNSEVKSVVDPFIKKMNNEITLIIQNLNEKLEKNEDEKKNENENENKFEDFIKEISNKDNKIESNNHTKDVEMSIQENDDQKCLRLLTKIKQMLKNISSSDTKKAD